MSDIYDVFLSYHWRDQREVKALADERLSHARAVANRIVFTLERDLQTVAGAGAIRRKLLDEANQLLARLHESGAENPLNLHLQAAALVQRGDLALSYDDLTQARQRYDEAIAIAERLAQADPGNSGWQRDLSVSQYRIADVARRQDNMTSAREGFEKYVTTMVRLTTADPHNAGWQKDVLLGYWALLEIIPQRDCTADDYLAAAEKVLAWFDQTNALDDDAQMPGIREFFQKYRTERGNGPCKEMGEK